MSCVVSRNEEYGTGFIGKFVYHASSGKEISRYVMMTNYHVMAAAIMSGDNKYTVPITSKILKLLEDNAKECQIKFINSTGHLVPLDLSQILVNSTVKLSQKVVNSRYGYFSFCYCCCVCCCSCCCYCYCCF